MPEIAPPKKPARPAPAKTSSKGRGCLIGVALLALFGGYFVWTLRAPRIAATAFKERLRVGRVREVVMRARRGEPGVDADEERSQRRPEDVGKRAAANGQPRGERGTSSVVVARDFGRPRSRAYLTDPGVSYFSR